MNEEPDSGWMTKKEVVSSTVVFLSFGFLCLFSAIFSDMGPITILGTAFFFFIAGVGSAPLFYKFWFKGDG